jgi:N-acetylglucosaminyl-diphospho-decaprenol L-rhamnosyltransferase
MNKIAIVIPVHNGLTYTKKCLKSLEESYEHVKKENFYTILVDDGSTDGTSDWVKENYPNVIICEGDGNLWWTGAINVGCKYAIEELNADYMVWWNNDIVTEPSYFVNLEKLLETDEKDILIGSKVMVKNPPNLVWTMGCKFDPYTGERKMYGFFEPDSEEYNRVWEVDWLTGMGTVLSKEIMLNVGWLNEKDFPHYHGDSDYSYRVKLAGYKLKVYPQIRIWNDVVNTGLIHSGSFKMLWRSLVDRKSNFNIKKEWLFYRYYAKSWRAYLPVIKFYTKYIGGFFKWKFLGLFGIKKKAK